MNRRSFFRRLGAAVAGYALSGQLSGLLPPPPQVVAPEVVADKSLGISIRFIQQWDIVRPEWAERVHG